MFSLLIQNKRTLELFRQYHSLFLEALRNETVGVCEWMEEGNTVESALPLLDSQVGKKEEWRAIIIQAEYGDEMKRFAADPCNPYDFELNRNSDRKLRESEIPLIRLTQMLGGVPAPEVQFETVREIQPDRTVRIIYKPKTDPEEEHLRDELNRKYRYNGKLPSEIIVITVRYDNADMSRGINNVWKVHLESSSSEFWRRNQYANNTRFLVFDAVHQGKLQKQKDMFHMWTAIMLLATNETDPSTLQAYRLYRLNVMFKPEEMRSMFQQMINRLTGIQYYIAKQIRLNIREFRKSEGPVPKFEIRIPVSLETGKDVDLRIRQNIFRLTARKNNGDLTVWNENRQRSEEGQKELVKAAQRILDRSADHMRELGVYEDTVVKPLNKNEEADLRQKLFEIQTKVYESEGALPDTMEVGDRDKKELVRDIRDSILTRMTGTQAVKGTLIPVFLMIASFVPACFYWNIQGFGDRRGIFLSAGIAVAVFIAAALAVLQNRKTKLNEKLREYNGYLEEKLQVLNESSERYSDFMSAVSSYMRGSSYLEAVKKLQFKANEEHDACRRHLKTANSLLEKIKDWALAMHIPINQQPDGIEDIFVDTNEEPSDSSIYTFETGKEYKIYLNDEGAIAVSPFAFVDKLMITREELYDDKCS